MQNSITFKNISVAVMFFTALSFLGLSIVASETKAQGVFGGIMTVVQFCTCNGGHIISVGPPRPGRFYYAPGTSKLFQYGQITRSGVWVLGTYSGMTPCLGSVQVKKGTQCVPVPHQGNIDIVGTSL